jgi:hypothetical protein
MQVEAKLQEMGLMIPAPTAVPADMQLPFAWVRVRGNRAYISGHGPVSPDGSIPPLRGKVGKDVSVEEAYGAARSTALAILGSL